MSGQAPAPTAEDRLDALRRRESTSGQVEKIETAGHRTSMGAAAVTIGCGAGNAMATGGIAAVGCYLAPFAAGIAGAIAGARLAEALALDDTVLGIMGAPTLAQGGPQPAVIGHAIAHGHPFAGALGGLLAGIAAGVIVAVAVGATLASGGLAAPVLVGAAAALAGGFSGSFVGSIINGICSKLATVSGQIVTGSPDVFFEGKPVARVTDKALCDKHSPPPEIAEGSKTIFVNGLPLARIGHRITCSGVVQQGCTTVFADTTTVQYGPIDSGLTVFEQSVLSLAEVALCLSAVRFRSSRWGKLLFGEPIDPSDGAYVDFRTDLAYPGVIPLTLARAYSGKERIQGLLGTKWICNWSQRLVYDPEKPTAVLEDGDGEVLQFALGSMNRFNARHLKAPHYHLTGNRECTRLFDSRTQQTLIFTPSDNSPHIGLLTAIEDRNANRIDFIYRNGRLCRVEHSDGEVFTIGTTPQGYIETVTRKGDVEPLVCYRYDYDGGLTDVWSTSHGEFHYSYTSEGWLSHWRDSGATSVDLEYDSEGRVIATRTPEGIYNDRFIYHPEERKTEYIDAVGARTTIWFNESNLPVREQDPLGNETVNEWDGLERRISTTDPLGRVTRYDYDPFGLLTAETDGRGRTTRYSYDKYGQLTRIELPNGGTAVRDYDGRGNLVSATEPDGSIFRYGYDERGILVSETGPDGAETRWMYDSKGRPAASIDPLGNRTGFEHDAWGRLRALTDAVGHATRYYYEPGPDNPRADVSRIVHPDGGEEHFSYDGEGLLSSHTGPEGQVTGYRHGAFDLPRTHIDPKGYVTSLEYDGAARLKRITNASGQQWSFSYDAAGRLVVETDWAGCRTVYTRDPAGRVIAKHLPDGVEQRLSWDERDRILAVETARTRIAYDYDDADRLIRAATYNLLDGNVDEPETEILLSYDEKGRLTREIQNGAVIDYRYDAAGRCINRKSPSGETNYVFDPLGLLVESESNGHGLQFKRSALGLETGRRYGAGKSFGLLQSFDACGRLKSQFAGRLKDVPTKEYLPPRLSPALELAGQISRRYRWDKSGRLVGIKDSQREPRSYAYDPRDQVAGIRRPVGHGKRETLESYDYDALMNLVRSNGNGHDYDGNVVTRVGMTRYTHDGRGRVITKTLFRNGFRPRTWHFRWDDFDRLAETWTPDGACWRYTCDAFGRRVKKECVQVGKSGEKAKIGYLWQGATLAEEWKTHENGPTLVSRWHFEPGTFNPIAKETLTLGAEKAGEARFYPIVTDHLGTPKELFDSDGECLWQADHSLWGRISMVRRKTEGGSFEPVVDCTLRFQNQWEDDETGLYYNLHRYYDPDSGQYLSQDPIGLEGGLRTHGYVHDPVQWVDPWGLAGCSKNTSNIPRYTFRGDTRPPSQIFKTGFKPRGTNTDLLGYARHNDPSVFVGTSTSPKTAGGFAGEGGYVYTVRPGNGAVDVNSSLGKRSPFPHETEIAVSGGISPSDIMGARKVGSTGLTGPFIRNSKYIPN